MKLACRVSGVVLPVLLTAGCFSAGARGSLPNPCGLVSAADVGTALGVAPPPASSPMPGPGTDGRACAYATSAGGVRIELARGGSDTFTSRSAELGGGAPEEPPRIDLGSTAVVFSSGDDTRVVAEGGDVVVAVTVPTTSPRSRDGAERLNRIALDAVFPAKRTPVPPLG